MSVTQPCSEEISNAPSVADAYYGIVSVAKRGNGQPARTNAMREGDRRDYIRMRNLVHASHIRACGAEWIEWSKTDAARAKGRLAMTHEALR